MTEITPQTVRFGFVAVNLLAAVAGLVLYTRVPRDIRRYAALAVAVIAFYPVVIVLQEFEVGAVAIGNGTVDLLAISQSVFATTVIYGLVLISADVSRRLAVTTIAVALVPTIGPELLAVIGQDPSGLLGVVFLISVVVMFFLPFPVLLYLFFRPIWDSAAETSPRQRLLHWKSRNILLFVYGMLLAYIPLVLTGFVTNPVLDVFVQEYSTFFLYSGIGLYILYNYSTLTVAEAETVDQYASRLLAADG